MGYFGILFHLRVKAADKDSYSVQKMVFKCQISFCMIINKDFNEAKPITVSSNALYNSNNYTIY